MPTRNLPETTATTQTMTDHIQKAIFNLKDFDLAKFRTWIVTRPQLMQDAAAKAPPDRIYELPDGQFGFVLGYHQKGLVVVDTGIAHVAIPAEKLKDVTEAMKQKFGER